ncbi:MAG: OST-HTH/LOTUS domain-containing protein, partial [Burkholderiales bacterium]
SNGAPLQAAIPKPLTGLESPVDIISQAIEQGADEAGWAFLGAVGNYVTKIQPDFDPRLYGCRKLSDLLKKYPGRFETSERGSPGSPTKMIYARVIAAKVRDKRAE